MGDCQTSLFFAEAVLKAEVLYKTEVMSRAELANGSEYSPALQYDTVVKPTILSMPETLPGDEVAKSQAPLPFEELPRVEPPRSEISLGSNESSTLEDSSMLEAFPGPEELSNVEFSMSDGLAEGRYFSEEYLPPEAAAATLGAENYAQGDEPPLDPLRMLTGLQDPFADVEADVPPAPEQVANVLWSRQGGLGAQMYVQGC